MEPNTEILVSSRPSPFSMRRVQGYVPFGMSVKEIVEKTVSHPELIPTTFVELDGHVIEPEVWHLVKPKPGTSVIVGVEFGKGGGKNPLASVLSLALLVAAPYLGAALGTNLGLAVLGNGVLTATQSAIFGGLVTGAVSLVGSMAIRAIAPPPKPKGVGGNGGIAQDTPTKFFTGAQNQVSRYGVIPQVLGRYRMVPPLGAFTYTETVGQDQYLRMLFVWGYGPLLISDLKIGETAIGLFDDVEVETRQGYLDDDPLTLYTKQVQQSDLSITLTQAAGYQVRTTAEDVDEISVDITFQQGLVVIGTTGKRTARAVELEVQYAPTGTSDWSAGLGSFKPIASQNTAAFTLPPGGKPYLYKRNTMVCIHKSTGVQKVIYGESKYGFNVSGAPVAASYTEPVDPPVPSDHIAVARVVSLGTNRFFSVTSLRAPWVSNGTFEASGDFNCTTSSTHIAIAAGGLKNPGVTITATKTVAVRKSFKVSVPRGTYDVRIKRVTADAPENPPSTQPTIFDIATWTALRSVRHENPVSMPGLALTAVRIRATDQLNGNIESFNAIVQSILPSWNGSAWVERPTSNPADLYRHVLQGSANAFAVGDSRIDFESLQNWAEWCDDNGFEYNEILSTQSSVIDQLTEISATARAAVTSVDGKWGVVQDIPVSTPTQYFTNRNSWGFTADRWLREIPHAVRVQFTNEDKGWSQDERIVFDDGYDENNATVYDVIQAPGVTNSTQAYKTGRYHIAVARLRPEIYKFTTDVENLQCTRGDVVGFVHDVPLFGLGSARVTQLLTEGDNTIGIVMDEEMFFDNSTEYAARFRKEDGTSVIRLLDPISGYANAFSFEAIDTDLGPEVDNLVLIGVVDHEMVKIKIKSIEPGGDLTAVITCVDEAPGVHLADKGVIPPYSSQITLPAALEKPPTPVAVTIQTNEQVLFSTSTGYEAAMVISLLPPASPLPLELVAYIKRADDTAYLLAEYTTSPNRCTITNLDSGVYYDVKLLHKNINGQWSDPLNLPNTYVVGDTGNPSDVETFDVSILAGTAYLAWTGIPDLDLDFYRIKFNASTSGASWSNSIVLVNKVGKPATTISVPAMQGTYLIKAVDKGGRESTNAITIVNAIALLQGYNSVETASDDSTFVGRKVDVELDTGYIRLSDDMQYGEYYFNDMIDLRSKNIATLSASITAVGIDLNTSVDAFLNVDDVENWDGATAPSTWDVTLQYRATEDDPWIDSTNMLTQAIDLTHADWTKTRSVATANTTLAPDGTTTADTLREDNTSTNTHRATQSKSFTNGQAYTLSVYAKAKERSFIMLELPASAFPGTPTCFFNLADGAMGTPSGCTAVTEVLGNGWVRCSITATADATTTGVCAIGLATNITTQSYTGDNASGVCLWQAQLKNAAAAYSATWTDWRTFVLGEAVNRAFQFRALLSSFVSGVTPAVTSIIIKIQMPDRVQGVNNLTSASTDVPTVVNYPDEFYTFNALTITAQSMQTGDYYTVTGVSGTGLPDEVGFGIIFKNAAGTRITRTFDYIAKGFGIIQ